MNEHDLPKHLFGEWCYQFGPHLLTTCTYRRFWKPWKKRHVILCYECDIRIAEW
jgi:hypothetical protein